MNLDKMFTGKLIIFSETHLTSIWEEMKFLDHVGILDQQLRHLWLQEALKHTDNFKCTGDFR